MGIRKVVLTAITDVENVSDLEGIDAVCILCVVPVSKPESTGEDLVWIAVSNLSKFKIKQPYERL